MGVVLACLVRFQGQTRKINMILLKNCGQVVISRDGKPKIGNELGKIDVAENVDVLIENDRFVKIDSA